MPDGEERGRDPAADGGVPAMGRGDRQAEGANGDEDTEARRLRERVRELERRNERLESAVAAFHHDFRGALVIASNHLELARDGPPEPHLDPIDHAHDRMDTMVEELREVADGDVGGARRPLPLADLAEECWAGVDPAGAELVVETDATVVADRARLLRLLENLFRNAVEHGSTSVQLSDDDCSAAGTGPLAGRRRRASADLTVTIGTHEDGFYVADDGPGIPAAERERVFEEGYTTGDDETGLGLAIVRRIAAEHGWSVDVTESEAGGARFDVTGVELRSGR